MERLLSSLKPPRSVLRPVSLDSLDMTLLRDSMQKNGLLVPLTVSDDVIVNGYRRYLVARGFGWETIPCHEVKGNADELRIISQTRQLDFGRDDKRALIGDLLARNASLTANSLSQSLQWSPVEVESLAGVEYLIPEFGQRYRSGEISLATVWHLSRCRDDGQLKLLSESGQDNTDLADAAKAMHREVRAARRRSMVSRPRGKGYNQIVRERDLPREAGPELIKCGAKTPLDGWTAALNWILGNPK